MAERPRVVLFGDSVMAGYGLPDARRPSALLAERFRERAAIVCRSAPDRTSEDGLALVADVEGAYTLVGFGLNDAMQGLARERTQAALEGIVETLRANGSSVRLVEAIVPQTSIYPARIDHVGLVRSGAETTGSNFLPDMLFGLDEPPGFLQDDGLHPDENGSETLSRRLAAHIEQWLGSATNPEVFNDRAQVRAL